VWISKKTDFGTFELDELWWFIGHKEFTETRENTYIMIMMSREPRQVVAFVVDKDRKSFRLQGMVDSVPDAQKYCTDGFNGYLDVIFPGKHIYNDYDKSDTHNVESINADLRHYIAGLRRKSRCFFRKLETLRAVLYILTNAYNKFGEAKLAYRQHNPNCGRDFPFSLVNFI
jgi:IS1 family transposase